MSAPGSIVFAVHGTGTGRTGGQRFWASLIQRSRELGLSVRVPDDLSPPVSASGNPLRRAIWNVRFLGDLHDGVVCYDSSDHGGMALLGRRLRSRPRVRLVCVVHHLRERFRLGNALYGRAMRANETAMLRLADKVIVHTHSTRDAVQSRGVEAKRIVVVRQGWCASPARTPVRTLDSGEPLRLLWVGGDFERKGLSVLLRALADTPVGDAALTVVGSPLEGRESRDACALAEGLGIANRVSFLGPVSDEDLEAAWGEHDVYVLPSSREGHGRAVDEALNHGVPVLLSDLAVFRERLRDQDALFVPVGSATALAEAIRDLRDISLRTRLSESGYEASRTFPSWKAVLDAHVECLAGEI